MASSKGIAITAAIVAAIVSASFLVWIIPQSSPGSTDIPRTDAEVISDVYSRHLDRAAIVESDFSGWKNGTLRAQDMVNTLDEADAELDQMLQDLSRTPAQDWRLSYDNYEQAAIVYAEYLDEIRAAVGAGNTGGPFDEIDGLKMEWQDLVDQSVAAMPASRNLTSQG